MTWVCSLIGGIHTWVPLNDFLSKMPIYLVSWNRDRKRQQHFVL